MIHPTAVVHPSARLGQDVIVGPYTVIGEGVEIGDRTRLGSHVVLEKSCVVGTDCVIGAGSVLGGDPQDLRFDASMYSFVKIGNHSTLREHVTVHRATSSGAYTSVGDRCFLMAGCHVGHDGKVRDGAILANNVLLGGHVEIGEKAFLGGGSVFHQFVRVGNLVICQGGSKFSRDIPPYLMAADLNGVIGLNVLGLRRAGFGTEQRAILRTAFALLYRQGMNVTQALQVASQRTWPPEAELFFDFARSSKKGICFRLADRRGGTVGDNELA
jgi:UDP-N-acetylglucosamine acyltransferase